MRVALSAPGEVSADLHRTLTIHEDLAPGDHELHCELLEETKDPQGGHEFRVISVMRCDSCCSQAMTS